MPHAALSALLAGIQIVAVGLPVAAADPNLDARVVWVSSGPWIFAPERTRHRAVAWEAAGEMRLRVEKIAMSPEGDLSRVSLRDVDLGAVGEPIYTIDRIEWSRPDRFALRVNGLPFGVVDLDRDVPVIARPR